MKTLVNRAKWLIAVLVLVTQGAPQVAQKANQEYSSAAARSKAAAEMEHPIRKSIERTADLAASLGIRRGDVVADVGTGAGYFLPHLVEAVGEHGRVFAEDIHPDFLHLVDQKITRHGWKTVTRVLGTDKDPRLPPASLDVVLILDTYHHLDYPNEMLASLQRALKPAGRLIIVDFYRSRKHPGATDADLKSHVRLDRDEVVREVTANRFRLERKFDHLPHEYVLIFRKSAPSKDRQSVGHQTSVSRGGQRRGIDRR